MGIEELLSRVASNDTLKLFAERYDSQHVSRNGWTLFLGCSRDVFPTDPLSSRPFSNRHPLSEHRTARGVNAAIKATLKTIARLRTEVVVEIVFATERERIQARRPTT